MSQKSKRWVFLLYIIMNMMLLGCWNNREIDEMSLTSAIGLDKAPDNKVELTLQIVKPSSVKNPGQPSGMEEPTWTYCVKGDTVFEAFRNTYDVMDGRLFINQSQLLIIGEALAKEDLLGNLDFFERELEFNLKVQVLIAKGITAKEAVSARTDLSNIPALHIMDIITNNSKTTAKIKKVILFDLLQDISHHGKQAVIPTIQKGELQQEDGHLKVKDLKVEGTAIIDKGKLVGYLNDKKTRGLLFAEDEVKSTIINIPNPLEKDKLIAIEVLRSKGKLDVTIEDGQQIVGHIDVELQSDIGEVHGNGNIYTKDMIEKLNKEIEDVINQEIEDALQEAKKNKADIFGFGEMLHRKYPQQWKQLKSNWGEHFSSLPVHIKIKSTLKRSGFIQKPTDAQ